MKNSQKSKDSFLRMIENEAQNDENIGFKRALVLDCPTRWNSTYFMIQRLLILRIPLTRFIASENSTLSATSEDRWIELTKLDWEIATELSILLVDFDKITRMISGAKYPTFSQCIPLYNSVLDLLQKFKIQYQNWINGINNPYHELGSSELEDFKEGVIHAVHKMDNYYSIQSDLTICAVILDPRFNAAYYRNTADANPGETQQQFAQRVNGQIMSAITEVKHYYLALG
jgi:hypothetical protein